MNIWRISIVFCTFCIIFLFVCAISTREKQYKRKSTYDNKSCRQSDINLRVNLPSAFGCLAYSMGRRSGTVFYHPGTGVCIGCYSAFINVNDLIYDDGTIAYEYSFECDDGEEKFKTSCYRPLQPTGWISAKSMCLSSTNNSHLAVPESDEENSYIASWITRGTFSNMSIGVWDIETEGTYLTVQGDDVLFTNWEDGEPNGGEDDEDCVQLKSYGEWDDFRCFVVLGALCETEMLII